DVAAFRLNQVLDKATGAFAEERLAPIKKVGLLTPDSRRPASGIFFLFSRLCFFLFPCLCLCLCPLHMRRMPLLTMRRMYIGCALHMRRSFRFLVFPSRLSR